MIQRKKRNSSKTSLTISFIFHGALILGVFFLAAREGILGKKLKEITVTMAPKEKKEPVKKKPPEPKPEQPKPADTPKQLAVAPPKVETSAPPPPAMDAPPAVAPPAAVLSGFEFSDGARPVQDGDPIAIYKGFIEHSLRSHWNRPEDTQDDKFLVEVELSVDSAGKLGGYDWLKGSGDGRWDQSVKLALAATKSVSRPPPKNFPPKFVVRFDVDTVVNEDGMRISSR